LEELKKKFLGMNDDEIKDVRVEMPLVEKKKSFWKKLFEKRNVSE